MNGDLKPEQADALRPHVIGRHVHDLGAGDLMLTGAMLDLGARYVTAVDKGYTPEVAIPWRHQLVELVPAWFHEYAPREPIEVALVSWPPHQILIPPAPEYVQGLIDLCAAAAVVAYLGSNFGSVCGNPELWQHLGTREVLEHVPHPRNTLIVYGRKGGRIPGQGLLPEERAALYRHVVPHPTYGVTYG